MLRSTKGSVTSVKEDAVSDLLEALKEIASPLEGHEDEYDQIMKDIDNIMELPN